MGIERIYKNEGCQVLKAKIKKDSRMPVHYATSEAFVMVTKGSGEIIYSNSEQKFEPGAYIHIPKAKPHVLKIEKDFEAYIIIEEDASLEFTGGTTEAKDFASGI